ncbi:CHAP domain-containing protein [Hoyosella rhizosphaerae]|uniref:Peptidase C51 domain-containing protein n=1 Tax=Hoyosella rhizosphaerae TaxID=1755582 RepID=A0A916U0B5_9ACTN|nr:CHAP domain-containing protein [Hoyosella rhizosphaerae]MBN4927015.1 CHAP domain-containing protein [Hoyosella rhizosphaerae]GGC54712.1 hypothetical protein GCM10011410_03870 [Hoyosella rhizosphaerae]
MRTTPKDQANRASRRIPALAASLVVIVGLAWAVVAYFDLWNMVGPREFPAVETAELDDRQAAVIEVLRREFAENPPGEKYSEGSDEAWCANFVSWVMREAEMPLENPNSGWWRIPGVYTLEEYYRADGRFESRESGYEPKVGDVILYAPRSKFTQHTSIVVRNDDGVLTTVGGNEFLRGEVAARNVRTSHSGIVGYGVL